VFFATIGAALLTISKSNAPKSTAPFNRRRSTRSENASIFVRTPSKLSGRPRKAIKSRRTNGQELQPREHGQPVRGPAESRLLAGVAQRIAFTEGVGYEFRITDPSSQFCRSPKQVNPDVQIDLWAMTTLVNLQLKGYVRVG
jgi:hypothetical protein